MRQQTERQMELPCDIVDMTLHEFRDAIPSV